VFDVSDSDEARLLALRSEFPTLDHNTHLVSHSLGAVPQRARDYLSRYLDEWEEESVGAWTAHWLPFIDELADLIARVLGAPPGTVVLGPNVSTLESLVASCFDFAGPRNRVVYTDLNFSSVNYVWQEQRRRGAEVVVVEADDGVRAPTARLLEAIDERTLIVPVSHVLFRSSGMQDVRGIVERAHAVGALVLLDTYQSAGTVPLSIADWGVDFCVGGSIKWACGGPGTAYLYVDPDLYGRLRPAQTGWFAHARPFGFESGPLEPTEGRWRFMNGTPTIPALYAARAGWELLAEAGVEAIREKSLRQTALLRREAEARGFVVNTPRADAERGGTLCFDRDGAQELSRALLERGMLHDFRPRCGLRVSPHYYTTDEEIRRFFDAIDELA